MKLQETCTENTYEWSSYLVILKISLIVSTGYSAKRKITVSWRSFKEYLWKKQSRLFCTRVQRRRQREKRQNKIRTTMRNVDVWQLNEAVFANRVRPILSSFFARRESAFIEISWLIRTKRANTRLDTIQWVVFVVVVGAISHDLRSRTLKRWRRTKIFLQFTYTRYSSGVSPSAYVSDPWLRVKRRQLPFVPPPPPPPSPRSLPLLFSLSFSGWTRPFHYA